MRRTVFAKRMSMNRFKSSKQITGFPYLINDKGVFNHILFFFSFLSFSYFYSFLAISFFFNFICHLLTIYLSLTIILLLLLILFYYHCYYYYYYYNCYLINITGTVILEKSSEGEFKAKNSSGMAYPYHHVK